MCGTGDSSVHGRQKCIVLLCKSMTDLDPDTTMMPTLFTSTKKGKIFPCNFACVQLSTSCAPVLFAFECITPDLLTLLGCYLPSSLDIQESIT